MKAYKRLKDPIYGYIQIPVKYMTNIVDTAEFQRLRRIIQTSYSPLYSSAVHNRFVHSIGVFYLGTLTVNQLKKEISEKINTSLDLEIIGEIFKLACLLHDVGHAPFSHTGENFFLGENYDYSQLHFKLAEAIGSSGFKKDIPEDTSLSAAPHEIMSALIGILRYTVFFGDVEQKEFFARCITGYIIVAMIISEKTNFTYLPMDVSGISISMKVVASIIMKRLLTQSFIMSMYFLLPFPLLW